MPTSLGTAAEYSRSANVPTQGAATIACWVNLAANAAYGGVMSLFSNASTREIGIISVEGSSTMNLYWTNAGASASATLSTSAGTGQWFYLALTSAGTAIGALDAYYREPADTSWSTATNSSTVDTLTPDRVFLNDDGYASNATSARYAHLKVWDAVLTTDELLSEMYSAFPVRYANLNVYCPLWNVGSDEIDYSGNARNLTVGGTPADYFTDGPQCALRHGVTKRYAPYVVAAGGVTIYNRKIFESSIFKSRVIH